MEKKLDGNYTRKLWTSPGGSTPQSSTSRKLTKLVKPGMQDTAGEVGTNLCDILLWTPSHGRAKAGRPAGTYIQQLCADTGCSLEDLPEAMDDRDGWQERVMEIRADGVTWWWKWLDLLFICWCISNISRSEN